MGRGGMVYDELVLEKKMDGIGTDSDYAVYFAAYKVELG
jgi:hypothetical protein